MSTPPNNVHRLQIPIGRVVLVAIMWITKLASYQGLILTLQPASDRRRYKVTPSLIDWTQT